MDTQPSSVAPLGSDLLRSDPPAEPLVFEPDDAEMLEQTATAGWGPWRVVAGARLAAEARVPRLTRLRLRRQPAGAEPRTADTAPPPAARRRPLLLTADQLCDARSAIQAELCSTQSERAGAGDEDAAWDVWAQSGPEWDADRALAALDEDHRLTAHLKAQKGWRRRASQALDRWADREVEFGVRIDRALAPLYWGGVPAARRPQRG